MNLKLKLAAGAVALACSHLAAGQITLYGQENFRGRSLSAGADELIPDLRGTRLDDRASSMSVRGGTWLLCSEPHYRGACVTVAPGDYPSLPSGLDNAVSSARRLIPPGERIAASSPATASPPVVLYEGTGFSGFRVGIGDYTDSLDRFNDRARSMIVYDGQWELCEHDRFRGECTVYGPGRYADLGRLAGDLSSLRPVDGHLNRPPLGSAQVVFYEGSNFRGRSKAMNEEIVANMREAGFDDRASSLRVDSGNWVLCSDANFQGRCWTFGPGEYPTLPPALQDNVSSARRTLSR